MRVDYQRLRPFRELLALLWGSVNENWNGQLNPLAAPLDAAGKNNEWRSLLPNQ